MDDEKWEIRFNFPGEDNLERSLCKSDITVKNLMALIEGHGYGYQDTMYYVKEKGKGFEGMDSITSMAKVEQMLELFEREKVLVLTVLKHMAAVPGGLNRDEFEAPIKLEVPVVLSVDRDGVSYISEEDEVVYPVAVDYSDVVYIGTQQSCNMVKGKGKGIVSGESVAVEILDTEDDDDMFCNNEKTLQEDELIRKLKRQREEAEDPKEILIMKKLQIMKKQRDDPAEHIEGETNVEELCSEEEQSDEDEGAEEPFLEEKKLVLRPGPLAGPIMSQMKKRHIFSSPHLMRTAALMTCVTVMMMDLSQSLFFLMHRRGGSRKRKRGFGMMSPD